MKYCLPVLIFVRNNYQNLKALQLSPNMTPTTILQGDATEYHHCHAEWLDKANILTEWNRSSLLMNGLKHLCLYLVGFFVAGVYLSLLQYFSLLLIATQVLFVKK